MVDSDSQNDMIYTKIINIGGEVFLDTRHTLSQLLPNTSIAVPAFHDSEQRTALRSKGQLIGLPIYIHYGKIYFSGLGSLLCRKQMTDELDLHPLFHVVSRSVEQETSSS